MGIKFDSKPERSFNDVFVDGSDAYANKKKAWITFRYPIGGRVVAFKAFITSFNDTFSPSFEEDQVFGRTDPIKTYMGTKRSISLGFDVVAASDEEAVGNLEKVQKLAQFMYPTYDGAGDASTISGPPIIRLGFMNMITSQGTSPDPRDPGKYLVDKNKETGEETPKGIFEGNRGITLIPGVNIEGVRTPEFTAIYDNHRASDKEYGVDGLPGTISSVTYDFNLQNNVNNVTVGTGAIFSKIISVSVGFEPIHEHVIDGSTTSPYTNFPYGVNLENLSPELKKKFVVNPGADDPWSGGYDGVENYGGPRRETYLADAARLSGLQLPQERDFTELQKRNKAFQNINSGAEYLNNVKEEHQERLAKLKESQQQLDIAEARYNSLFGKGRKRRDERVADKRPDSRRGQRANQNLDAYTMGERYPNVLEESLTDPYDFESDN